MLIKRTLTFKQIWRVKIMCLIAILGITFSIVGDKLIQTMVLADEEQPDAPKRRTSDTDTQLTYVWGGVEYERYSYNPQPRGYIQEYTNKETFCTTGLYFPGVSLVSDVVLGIASLLLLLYLFLGVAIVADLFMEAIEVITSSKVIVHVMDPQNPAKTIPIERDFWNPTIANLTLLALGSSMPEILLSIFSTVGDLDGIPSELGPMGIVGSAAFNLFVISAVSIMAVTDGSKKILDMGVFMWTSFASSFAYLWFLLVLSSFSPDEVEVWEAFTTLGFFVVLCLVALALDKWTSAKNRSLEHEKNVKKDAARFSLKKVQEKIGTLPLVKLGMGEYQGIEGQTKASMENVRQMFKNAMGAEEFEKNNDFESLINCLTEKNQLERFMYRKEIAAKSGTRGTKSFVNVKDLTGQMTMDGQTIKQRGLYVGFKSVHYSVMEHNKKVDLTIVRGKECVDDYTFSIKTFDDSAKQKLDYTATDELLTMKSGEIEKTFTIDVVDNELPEPDKEFFIELGDAKNKERLDGDDTRCKVTIIDNDSPGIIGFKERDMVTRPKDQVLSVEIIRDEGSSGEATVVIEIVPASDSALGLPAVEGTDFEKLENSEIVFAAGEVTKTIQIYMPSSSLEPDGTPSKAPEEGEEPEAAFFVVRISDVFPKGVRLSRKRECLVEIRPGTLQTDDEAEKERNIMMKEFMAHKDPSWSQQFVIACMLGPAIDEHGALDDVTTGEAIFHWLAMPWKVFFAIVPPREKCGGWLAFCIALAQIGIVTFVVGEVANVLGCAVGLKTSVTAITFVALGTSLPDLFASASAARNSPYADSAVGNVTGSNAVNVFLGMGLPWCISSLYWKLAKEGPDGQGLNAPSPQGDLVFAVIVFLCCSFVCFFVLFTRQYCMGGVLGGPPCSRKLSGFILIMLWAVFVVICTLNAYGAFGEKA